MVEISLDDLEEASQRYRQLEKRDILYEMAIRLMNKGLEFEAFIFILATWNFAEFRHVLWDFDAKGFMKTIENEYNPILERLRDRRFDTTNFDEIAEDVERLYDLLSHLSGVGCAGATKLMHLGNPKLFVVWDGNIMKHYGFRGGTGKDYVGFLKKMQQMFGHIRLREQDKPLSRRIFEYNYVSYSLTTSKKEMKGRRRSN